MISTTGRIQQAPILESGNIGYWNTNLLNFAGNRTVIPNTPAVWGRYVYIAGSLGAISGSDTQVLLGFTSAPLFPDTE